jgi:hypothetical protein
MTKNATGIVFLMTIVLAFCSLAFTLACSPSQSLDTEPVAPFPANGAQADEAVSQYLLDLAQGHTHGMHLWADYHDKAGIQAGYYGDYEAGYKYDGWQIIHVVEEWDLEGSVYLQDVFEGVEPLTLHGSTRGWLLEWHVSPDGSVQPWNTNAVRLEAELQRD